MANVVNGNTIFIDTANEDLVVEKGVKVTHIMFTPTASSGSTATLQDVGSTPTDKILLEWNTNEQTQHYRFEHTPLVFPNGIRIGSLTSATLTVVYRKEGVPRKV